MWRREKFILVALLAAVVLVGSTLGIGCSGNENGGNGLPGMPRDGGPPDLPENLLARVAEILGIDQQKVQDAFAQARSEMQDEGLDARQPEALMARVAEILEIEQQELENGFAQARSEMSDQGPWQRPAKGNLGPRGANEE